MWPTARPIWRPPAPRSGARPGAGSTASFAPWAPAGPCPYGASLFSYYTEGELKAEGGSISEGIGQGRITANLEGLKVDRAYRIPDEEMLQVIFDMVEHEGLVMGGSTGVNVAGAMRLARDLGPGHTIVTILCDQGARYQSKIFNPAFLREKGLPAPAWL